MIDIQVDISREAIKELRHAQERFSRELGKSQSTAFRAASAKVLNSLSNDTKVAGKYREITDTGQKSRSGKNKKFIIRTKYRTPKRKGKALRASWQGDWRDQVIYARNLQEVRRRPAVIIAMAGLAAESWKAAGQKGRVKVKGTTRAATNKRIVKKAARRWVGYESNFKGNNQFVRITNALKYIREAVGPSAVEAAVRQGAVAMHGEIEHRIAKAAAKTGLA